VGIEDTLVAGAQAPGFARSPGCRPGEQLVD
jgi:hypothetical protein